MLHAADFMIQAAVLDEISQNLRLDFQLSLSSLSSFFSLSSSFFLFLSLSLSLSHSLSLSLSLCATVYARLSIRFFLKDTKKSMSPIWEENVSRKRTSLSALPPSALSVHRSFSLSLFLSLPLPLSPFLSLANLSLQAGPLRMYFWGGGGFCVCVCDGGYVCDCVKSWRSKSCVTYSGTLN